LCLEAKPGFALPICADPKIRDEFSAMLQWKKTTILRIFSSAVASRGATRTQLFGPDLTHLGPFGGKELPSKGESVSPTCADRFHWF
jgi:hypothetical protein